MRFFGCKANFWLVANGHFSSLITLITLITVKINLPEKSVFIGHTVPPPRDIWLLVEWCLKVHASMQT